MTPQTQQRAHLSTLITDLEYPQLKVKKNGYLHPWKYRTGSDVQLSSVCVCVGAGG